MLSFLRSTGTIIDAVVEDNMYYAFTSDTRHGPLTLDLYR
jgi:hypothetical protein